MKKFTTWGMVAILVMLAAFFTVRHQLNTQNVSNVGEATTSAQKTTTNASDTKSNEDAVDQAGDSTDVAFAGTTTDNANTNSYDPNTNSQSVSNMMTTPSTSQVAGGRGSGSSVSTPVVPNNPTTPTNPTQPTSPTEPTNPTNPTNPTQPTDPVVTPVAPTVSITAPAANATVNGAVTVSASAAATSPATVKSVAFTLDGQAAATVTTSPYSFSWDTTKVANGTHTLGAVATDSNGLTKTAANVAVTVNNVTTPVTPPVTDGNNLIVNPSFEDNANNLPTGWTNSANGTTATFTYNNDGHTGNRSVTTTVTAAGVAGSDAKWYPSTATNVTAGGSYRYSNWYKSNVSTEIDAAITMSDGTTQYFYVAGAAASTDWAQVNVTFQMPAGAVSATFYHTIVAVGTLQVDDASLATYTPAPFNQGLVSITIDDGQLSEFTNGLPALQKYNMLATYYLLTGSVDYPDYMTYNDMMQLKNAGMEIGGHTVDHCDLTGVNPGDNMEKCPRPFTTDALNYQVTQNKTDLLNNLGINATNFATPYGAYNDTAIAAIKAAGYTSHRSTDVGYNTKDNFNPYNIKVQNITNTTTVADVQAWVAQAMANKSWLVIVYHEISDTPEDTMYSVTPANFDAELAAIKNSGIAVKTVAQALAELQAQL